MADSTDAILKPAVKYDDEVFEDVDVSSTPDKYIPVVRRLDEDAACLTNEAVAISTPKVEAVAISASNGNEVANFAPNGDEVANLAPNGDEVVNLLPNEDEVVNFAPNGDEVAILAPNGNLPMGEVGDVDVEMVVDDGVGGEEESAQVMVLTTDERVECLEGQVESLKGDVEQIKSRMRDLINNQNSFVEHRAANEKSMVSMAAFEKMIDEAIESGTKLGVSRRYITRFLVTEHGIEDNRYLQKKLGIALKKKLLLNEYLLSDSLYKMKK